MKAWTRVPPDRRGVVCGGCNRPLPPGTPICELSIDRVARILIRCEVCEGPAPRELRETGERPEIIEI
jgi:RNase P subunit RPR2